MTRRKAVRISTDYAEVARSAPRFEMIGESLYLEGFRVARASLWRCADGSFIARAEWRKSKRDTVRYTETGIRTIVPAAADLDAVA